jgi:hypothetical protein
VALERDHTVFHEIKVNAGDLPLWQHGNCHEAFLENARLFFKNAWQYKDIFREFEAFL